MNDLITMLLVPAAISIVGTALIHYLRAGKERAQKFVSEKLPEDKASVVNALLETAERLVENAVHAANSEYVIGMKATGLFTPETASSVKQAVIEEVMQQLGPLKDQAVGVDLESVIGNMIQKHVLKNKSVIDPLVEKAKTPA